MIAPIAMALALGIAYLVGAPPLYLAPAAALSVVGLFARGLLRILLDLAAAVALVSVVPATTLGPEAAVAVSVALLASLPIVRSLGFGLPQPQALFPAAAALATAAAFLLTEQGQALARSDLSAGAIVVALAAGLFASASVLGAWRGRAGSET